MTVEVALSEEPHVLVREIGRTISAAHAGEVDRDARFPVESIDALRQARLLSALIPTRLGGAGLGLDVVAQCCYELGRHCGASAMVFAMHQIQVACLVRHTPPNSPMEEYLRELVEEQRLIASVTSEIGTGGDISRSVAALEPRENGQLSFEKQATTVSYGAHADDYLTTLRSSPSAEAHDQVLVLSRGEQTTLELTGTWDVMGMRGTCSPGFVVKATVAPWQVVEAPFSHILAESMGPISHILWSHLWLGIATDAFDRARQGARAAARRSQGQTPPSAVGLSRLMSRLALLRSEVRAALADFLQITEQREQLNTVAAGLRFNNLKVAASDQLVEVCQEALRLSGVAGFRNDSPYSVARHLRDALSAPLMIANERLHHTNASMLLVAKEIF